MEKHPSFIESLNSGLGNFPHQSIYPDPQQWKEIDAHWSGLQYLGIVLDFTEDCLLCHHEERAFSFSVPYDKADSEELHRELFAALRKSFGGFRDVYLGAIFLPSREVATLFTSFKALLSICTNISRLQTIH